MPVTKIPLVSIAMCTYNGEKYLTQQLDSLLKQTYPNIEIVITDDASTDSTTTILQQYVHQYSNMRFFVNEKNIGYNKNFEKTIPLCSGNYIAISDQDDIWEPNKIEVMLAAWNKTASLIYCSSKKIKSDSEISAKSKPVAKGYTGTAIAPLACKNTAEGHTIIFRQSLLPYLLPFADNIYYDWWIAAAAACNGGVQWIPQVLVWRRIHDTNAYEHAQKTVQEKNAEWEKHLTTFLQIKNIDKHSKVFIEQCLQLLHKPASKKQWYHFIYNNRTIFFYFKKGVLAYWSKLKHSKKLAASLAAGF